MGNITITVPENESEVPIEHLGAYHCGRRSVLEKMTSVRAEVSAHRDCIKAFVSEDAADSYVKEHVARNLASEIVKIFEVKKERIGMDIDSFSLRIHVLLPDGQKPAI